jgi:hypothetical protein
VARDKPPLALWVQVASARLFGGPGAVVLLAEAEQRRNCNDRKALQRQSFTLQ